MIRFNAPNITLLSLIIMIVTGAIAISSANPALAAAADFGPSNPFFSPSTLPFHAPPFDKIKDEDFQPAIEAGMAEQQTEVRAIADNSAAPTFDNTIVAMEKTGQLLDRVMTVFDGITGANTNDTLQKVKTLEAPKLAAHHDFIFLHAKHFARVAAIYKERIDLKLDPESLRLVERCYDNFVHAGANLSEADKAQLKKLNEEIASLSTEFSNKVLAATKAGAFVTTDKAALTGLSDAQIAAAAESAKGRKVEGYVIPLQNTTQQPDLVSLSNRSTRQQLFEDSWNRAEKSDVLLATQIEPRLPRLTCDERALKQVLLNFLSNAVKFTPAGGEVRVSVQCHPDRTDIIVEDTGRGMSEQQLSQIFRPFYTTRSNGTGLGLSLVRRIVEEHLGRIDVRSSLGKGSVFEVQLPFAPSAIAAEVA